MKYNIGNKIRVRNDLVARKEYGGVTFVESMIIYLGKTLIVDDMDSSSYIVNDRVRNTHWFFTDEMIDNDFKFGR